MKRASAFAFVLTACGGGQVTPGAVPSRLAPSRPAASSSATDPLPGLDELALRGAGLAPGMREASRGEEAAHPAARREVVRAATADTCARVAFVSDAPVAARLEGGAGDVLAASPPATSGALAAKGPACVHKGDVVEVVFEAEAGARVRWVAWASP